MLCISWNLVRAAVREGWQFALKGCLFAATNR